MDAGIIVGVGDFSRVFMIVPERGKKGQEPKKGSSPPSESRS